MNSLYSIWNLLEEHFERRSEFINEESAHMPVVLYIASGEEV